jgi:1-deoxy-D-xylulose-5-phosphate synthase
MNEEELRNLMYTAQIEGMGPFAIRYPKGRGVMPKWKTPMQMITPGKGRMIREGNDIAIITLGHVGNYAVDACEVLERDGITPGHFDLRFVKPLDEELLHHVFSTYHKIITVEDGTILGGMGSAILEFAADHGYNVSVVRMGVPDKFIEQGTVPELHRFCGFDAEGIIRQVQKLSISQPKAI